MEYNEPDAVSLRQCTYSEPIGQLYISNGSFEFFYRFV